MSNRHPIIPPPELVQEWWDKVPGTFTSMVDETHLATQAAQWGADQELEACCEVMRVNGDYVSDGVLRAIRRPKPPSLKEQALEQLDGIATCFRVTHMGDIVCDKIRKALEALPND